MHLKEYSGKMKINYDYKNWLYCVTLVFFITHKNCYQACNILSGVIGKSRKRFPVAL